jgi:hypothetical protein
MKNPLFLGDPKFGILLYKNELPKSLRLPERLEETIGDSKSAPYMWMEALVGYNQKMPEYRDCVDCKMGEMHIQNCPPQFSELVNIYNDTKTPLKECVEDYEKRYNIHLGYMEAINYIRYGTNQHFQVHTDNGFSYTCTTSSCMYLNDDYEGGELWFPYLDLTFKPDYGDIVLFPSTYIYAHAAKPVLSGTKYSAVTMFDYNDNNHDLTRQASYSQEKNY